MSASQGMETSSQADKSTEAAQTDAAQPRTWRRRTAHLAPTITKLAPIKPLVAATQPCIQLSDIHVAAVPRVPRVPPPLIDTPPPTPTPRPPPPPFSHSLPLDHEARYAEYHRPICIDSFSKDADGELHLDDRSMRTYVEPPIGADLMHAVDDVVLKDWTNEHPDDLLHVLKTNEHDSKVKGADLIIRKDPLMKLCTAGFAMNGIHPCYPWRMNVMLVGSTLYVENHNSPQSLRIKAKKQCEMYQEIYPDLAFQQYCCESSVDVKFEGPLGWSGDVNTNEQWTEVLATRLGEHRIILAGETACVKPTGGSVELKLVQGILSDWNANSFERQMFHPYMLAYLSGTPSIGIGFGNEENVLVAFEEYDTLEVPEMAEDTWQLNFLGTSQPHTWYPEIGLNYAASIITWLRETLAEEQAKESGEHASEQQVWRLDFPPRSDELILRPVSERELRDEVQEGVDEGRVGFLMADYYDWARQL